MNYMLLVYQDESMSEKPTGCEGLADRLIDSGHYQAGGILQPVCTSTSVRIRDGKKLVTDGPFAETHEQLAGYLLIEAKDLDDAISVAAQHPVTKTGTVEIRPLLTIPEEPYKTSQALDKIKARFTRVKDRMIHLLNNTPDDKMDWSPSPTSRTPVRLAAHAAMATESILGMLQGKQFDIPSLDDFDKQMREAEKPFTTREQAVELLDKNGGELLAWIDTLTADQLKTVITGPFGPMPRSEALAFPADHLLGHVAQLEYIQTIYGDHNWHY